MPDSWDTMDMKDFFLSKNFGNFGKFGNFGLPEIPTPPTSVMKLTPSIQLLRADGYDRGGGKMAVDVIIKNPENASLVIGIDILSSDLPPRVIYSKGPICVPPTATSGCSIWRLDGIEFEDPFRAVAYRCISGPNCGAPSCAQFGSIADSTVIGTIVRWDGRIPDWSAVPISSECAPCTPMFECEQPLNGYEYDKCTQQRRLASRCVSIKKDSCLTVNTYNTPPFKKGENVSIYGVLEECGIIYAPDINGVPLRLKIKLDSITVFEGTVMTEKYTIPVLGKNWGYIWTVPDTVAGVDTSGKNVTVEAFYDGSDIYKPIFKTSTIGYIETKPITPAPTALTLNVDKTNIVSGDLVKFSGSYKPLSKINIFIEGVIRSHIIDTVTDSLGKYSVSAILTSEDTVTIKVGACPLSIVPGVECELYGDLSNYVNIVVNKIPPVTFTLSVDKTKIVSGDLVKFSGKYKPNSKINLFIEGTIRSHIIDTVTDSLGAYKADAVITIEGDNIITLKIGACPPSTVPGVECEIYGDRSNLVDIVVSPLVVTPPPPPGMKWKCTDKPDYKCIQATDGKYSTLEECKKACVPCKADETEIMGQCISSGVLTAGILIGLGAVVLITRRK